MIHDIPDPPPPWLVFVFGMPSGRYVLLDAQGGVFPLPAYGALDEGPIESLDAPHQAPGSPGALRTGFGTFKPLALDFGTGVATLDNWLEFETETETVRWERAFKRAARNAVRVQDTVTGEEYDGWVTRALVSKYQYVTRRKLAFTFQALDSHAWLSTMQVVNGAPAVCPNGAAEPAYPFVTLTASAALVTISDGARILTLNTTAGHLLTVDSGRADGLVTDNGGLGNYSGRFPRIAPGGSTITVTGASDVQVRYRAPAFGVPDISTGAGMNWEELWP